MNKRNTIKQIFRMRAALWVNGFFYYFRRLWLVGRLVPETIYAGYNMKNKFSIAALLIRQIIDFCGKPLYLMIMVWLPLVKIAEKRPELAGQEFTAMVGILFFANCFLGSLGDSQIFQVSRDKITCIKYLHMNARTYTQCSLALRYIPFFVYYLMWLLIAARVLGGTVVQGFFLWLMLFSFRMIGEARCSYLFLTAPGRYFHEICLLNGY